MPSNDQPCDRIYEKDGAYTAKLINDVPCCPSCGRPIKEHLPWERTEDNKNAKQSR